MLKKSKDFWKKKAQEELLIAENEKEKQKALETNQLGWDRRIKESQWLLKGVNKIDDSVMNKLVDKTTKAKSVNKFSVVDADLVNDPEQKAKEAAKLQAAKQSFTLVGYVRHLLVPGNKHGKGKSKGPVAPPKLSDRRRDPKQLQKEQIAEKLIEREERKNRRKFIKDGARRIKVLQNIGKLFKRPRMPTHHNDATLIEGYVSPRNEDIVEAYREANLTNYKVVPMQPVIEKLRSNEEVLAEERQRRTFAVSGRHHHYLGAHILYPLKIFPSTAGPLFPAHETPVYPETRLLPNEEEIRRIKQQEELQFIKENLPIAKIKKSKLNMSRRQFRLQQPIDDAHDEPSNQLLNYHPGQSNTSSLAVGSVTVTTHANQTVARGSPVRMNRQFEWQQRAFVDSDSVRLRPHGPLDLHSVSDKSEAGRSMGLTIDGRSAADDSLVQYNVDYRLTADPQSLFYQPPSSAPPRYRQSSSSSARRHLRDRSESAQQESVGGSQSFGQHSQHESSVNDWFSDNALRSNYFSAGSTAADPLVEVNMQRYRSMKKLDRHKVKGGFNLISKQSKERKLHDREEIVRRRLKEVSDSLVHSRRPTAEIE